MTGIGVIVEEELDLDYTALLPAELVIRILLHLPWRVRLRCTQVCWRWWHVVNQHPVTLFQEISGPLRANQAAVQFIERVKPSVLAGLIVEGHEQVQCGALGRALASARYLSLTCDSESVNPSELFHNAHNVRTLDLLWRYFLPDGIFDSLGVCSLGSLVRLTQILTLQV